MLSKQKLQSLGARFNNMSDDMREVLSGSIVAFVLRGLGAGLAFLFNVLIARLLGAEGAGLYFLALSIVMIGSVVARMGLDNALLRFISASAAQGNWARVKGVMHQGMQLAIPASFVTMLLVAMLAPLISKRFFHAPELILPLRMISVAIVTFSLMLLLSEALKGLKSIRNSMLVSGVLYPAFGLLLIWPLTQLYGPAGAALTYALATGLSAVIGFTLWSRAMRAYKGQHEHFPRQDMLKSSQPLWIMQIITRGVIPWLPLFLLGIWGTAEEAGIFGAAARISMLVSFFLVAVNTAIAPKFSELYVKGEISALRRLVRNFAIVITIATSPLFLVLLFASDWVMGLYGSDFIKGGLVLVVLTLGQAVNVITGSVGTLLMMTGHENDAKNSAVMSAIILILCSVIFIPVYKELGAAIASAAGISGANLISIYFLWKRLNIKIITF